MYLNSFLFPAPKCSYTAEILKDELMWIPKYQKKRSIFNRLHTSNSETTTTTTTKVAHSDINSMETPRNLVPQMKHKKNMPYSSKSQLKISTEGLSKMPMVSIINDERCQNQSKKTPKVLDRFENSIPDISSICDEKEENSEGITIKENKFKLFTDKNARNANDLQPSYNVSVDDGDCATQTTEPTVHRKKFMVAGPNLSAKSSKENDVTSDNSLFNVMETTPYIKPRAGAIQPKKLVKKMSHTVDFIEEKDCDYDEGLVNEHPTATVNTLNSPKNLYKYQTRAFFNPHNGLERNSARKVHTEYTETSPERLETSFAPIFEQKAKNANRLSLMDNSQESIEYYIPCILLRPSEPSNKAVLYFHGNGEDIHLARELLTHMRDQLNINVIGIEYPGYGMYKGASSEERIQMDAEAVFDYLTTKLALHPRNIIIFGRSIGSGPATWLASRKNIGALVLMSAFTSIRAVVQHLAGKWAQYLIKERFNNLEHISRVTCPTFIVHGLKDRLIPYKHSQELYNNCKGLCELVLPRTMNHIEFDFHDDFTAPLQEFLSRIHFGVDLNKSYKLAFPSNLFQTPNELKSKSDIVHRTPRY